MKYLLDTNTLIAFIKGNQNVINRLKCQKFYQIHVSSITFFELYFGAYNSRKISHNLQDIADIKFQVLDFEQEDARQAGRIRAELHAKGQPIGQYDLLLAGQAVNRNLILVTDNIGEFSRIAELTVENWLR